MANLSERIPVNLNRDYHWFILLIFVALFMVQCDTNYYEKYLPQNQQPNDKNSNAPKVQNVPPTTLPHNTYYIQLSTEDNHDDAQKVALQYRNAGHTPLMFYTPAAEWIITIGGGTNRFSAKWKLNSLLSDQQFPPNAKVIKPPDTWIGPIPLEMAQTNNSASGIPSAYATPIPGGKTASGKQVEPIAKETPREMTPEPKVYDITKQNNQPTSSKQSIYDAVREFFNPTTESDTAQQSVPLERYYLVTGVTNSLTAAKRIGEQYVLKGLPVFIWEKEGGTYSIVIGEPDSQENCEALREKLIEEKQISDGTIVQHSEQWLKRIFP